MRSVLTAAIGIAFGFVMSRTGFTSWDLVHGMFTFTDFQLLLAFMLSVGTLATGWIAIDKFLPSRGTFSPRGIHPGTIGGGVLFGAGWAISGGCPTISLAQIGEGQLAAFYTIGGILLGNWIYSRVHERYFKWPATSCLDE